MLLLENFPTIRKIEEMTREQITKIIRAHEAELRGAGVESLSLVGSVARGEATDASDVDVLVRLAPDAARSGFAYFARLEVLAQLLRDFIGRPVDVIAEPVRGDHLRHSIDKDAVLAF
ncbi:MAG TPA: nucleotidyltransferase domain-containing protein [Stellaceae bacterium]|nr:nucleotidyltransferase domain-containing protein [Stellaceae bacterium]